MTDNNIQNVKNLTFTFVLTLLFWSCHTGKRAADLIKPGSIGGLNIGDPVKKVQIFWPQYKLSRVDMGEFGVMIEVADENESIIKLKTNGEYAVDSAILPTETITYIETSHSKFKTKELISAGDLISKAEKIYGPATLYGSPDEELVEFKNIPKINDCIIGFKVTDPHRSLNCKTPACYAGLYRGKTKDGWDTTGEYKPQGMIQTINVSCNK